MLHRIKFDGKRRQYFRSIDIAAQQAGRITHKTFFFRALWGGESYGETLLINREQRCLWRYRWNEWCKEYVCRVRDQLTIRTIRRYRRQRNCWWPRPYFVERFLGVPQNTLVYVEFISSTNVAATNQWDHCKFTNCHTPNADQIECECRLYKCLHLI